MRRICADMKSGCMKSTYVDMINTSTISVLVHEVTSKMLASGEVLTANESGCDSGYIYKVNYVSTLAKNK